MWWSLVAAPAAAQSVMTLDVVFPAPFHATSPEVEDDADRIGARVASALGGAFVTVTIDEIQAYEDYSAAVYLEACPPGTYVGCAFVLGERGEAEWVVGAEVSPGPRGPRLDVSYIDVVSARTVFALTVEAAPDTEEAVVAGIVGTLQWLLEGGARTDDLRGEIEDVREAWEAGRLDSAGLAATIADLEGALGATFDTDRGAIDVPRMTDQDLEKYVDREGEAPWEQVGLTRTQYLRWRNSDLPLDAFRALAAGRLRSIVVRAGAGFGSGPYGESYDLRYVVGLTDTGWEELEVDAYQELLASSGPVGVIELGFGVLPWLEVAGAFEVRTGQFTYLQHQEVAGDNNTLLLPAESTPISTRAFGARVMAVPLPTYRVRPTFAVGLAAWSGTPAAAVWGLPEFAPTFPRPTLVVVEVFPGVEASVSDVVSLWARGRAGAALGTRFWTERTGEPLLQNTGSPVGSPGGGGGVEVGVTASFGPIGGVRDLDAPADDEPPS